MLGSLDGGLTLRLTTCYRILPVFALLLSGSLVSLKAAEMASATMTSTQLSATTWQYNIQLNDTGTTDIGTFWFSWVPGLNFLADSPTSVTSPASWSDTITH